MTNDSNEIKLSIIDKANNRYYCEGKDVTNSVNRIQDQARKEENKRIIEDIRYIIDTSENIKQIKYRLATLER